LKLKEKNREKFCDQVVFGLKTFYGNATKIMNIYKVMFIEYKCTFWCFENVGDFTEGFTELQINFKEN